MTDQVEHHRSVQYQLHDFALLASGFRVNPADGGTRIEVTGICPGCGGRTSTVWTYGSPGSYKGLWSRHKPTPAPAGPRTLCCDCGHSHADRPDDAVFLGCGAYWQIELPG